MSEGKKIVATLIFWAVIGIVTGLVAWRFPVRAQYPIEKTVQGIMGAVILGVFTFFFFPTEWLFFIPRFAFATGMAILGGFIFPYFGRNSGRSGLDL